MANDDVNRKKAPFRDVIEIVKSGQWGDVVYKHRLSCGHIEERKRVAPANRMACTWCVVAAEKEQDLRRLTAPQPTSQVLIDVADLIDQDTRDLAVEEDASRIQAGLAAALGVPANSVDVILEDDDGALRLSYAIVFLSASDAKRLAQPSSTIIDII